LIKLISDSSRTRDFHLSKHVQVENFYRCFAHENSASFSSISTIHAKVSSISERVTAKRQDFLFPLYFLYYMWKIPAIARAIRTRKRPAT